MQPPPELPLEVEEFLVWLAVDKGRARRTCEAYRRDLRAYCATLAAAGRDLHTADEDDAAAHLRAMQAQGAAPASVKRASAAVRMLYRFLAEHGHLPDDPTANLEVPKVGIGVPKALSEQQVLDILAAIHGHDPPARRDRAICEMLYGTGIRISELVAMDLADLNLPENLLRVLGKGDKQRIVPIGGCAMRALGEWLAPQGRGVMEPERWASTADSEAVWLNQRGRRLSRQGVWQIVKRHAANVGLGSQVSPHVFRHSCATHMLDHGADIRTVQELLGHVSISTTQIYTLVSLERQWEAYRAAHPRAAGPPA